MLAYRLIPPTVADTGGKYAKDSWICLSGLFWLKGYLTGEQKTPCLLLSRWTANAGGFLHTPLSAKPKTWSSTHQQNSLYLPSTKAITWQWTQQHKTTHFRRETHSISSIYPNLAMSLCCVLLFICINSNRQAFEGIVCVRRECTESQQPAH